MPSQSYTHKITPLKVCLCERCDNPATWQTTFLYTDDDGSESVHSENVCDKHAKEFADKHELHCPPDAK